LRPIYLAAATTLRWGGGIDAHGAPIRGSSRGAGYAVYNYAFYLFGAELNVFFPLYVASVLLGALTLGLFLSHLDVQQSPRLSC
jgi:hypothetical protein